ncbi:MAG TPA: ABC transporter permease [Thermoleophilaceae bacterium]|nr:ABC transporter permease [Thermoleophilaceae bacterium]
MSSTAGALWRQLRFERRQFWRNPSAAFFNFLLPLLLLVLVGSVYADDPEDLDILIPGIAGMAVMATTFTALAFSVTFLREQGVLKRILGTPLPAPVYLGGLIGSAVVNAALQVALIVAIGNLAYGVSLPEDPFALVVFTALGVVAFASLGIAFSQAIPNFDAAAGYVNVVFLPVIFVSGVFYSTESLPGVLEAIAEALPLKHVIDGLHGAIVTGAGVADNAVALAVVTGWGAVGIALATRYFRWE